MIASKKTDLLKVSIKLFKINYQNFNHIIILDKSDI